MGFIYCVEQKSIYNAPHWDLFGGKIPRPDFDILRFTDTAALETRRNNVFNGQDGKSVVETTQAFVNSVICPDEQEWQAYDGQNFDVLVRNTASSDAAYAAWEANL